MNTVYTSRQLVKLTELMEQHGMTPEILTRNLADGRLADIFAYAQGRVDRAKLHKAFGPLPLPPSVPHLFTEIRAGSCIERTGFEIEVDYDLTLEQMIHQQKILPIDGQLDPQRHTLRGMKGNGIHKKQIEPLWFGKHRKIAAADIRDWYPPNCSGAVIEDLLAFVARYGELLNHFVIVAPDASNETGGNRSADYVAYLYKEVNGIICIDATSVNTDDWFGFSKCEGLLYLTVRK